MKEFVFHQNGTERWKYSGLDEHKTADYVEKQMAIKMNVSVWSWRCRFVFFLKLVLIIKHYICNRNHVHKGTSFLPWCFKRPWGMQDKGLYVGKKPQGLPSVVSKGTGGPLGGGCFPKSSQVVVTAAPDCMLLLFLPPLQCPEQSWPSKPLSIVINCLIVISSNDTHTIYNMSAKGWSLPFKSPDVTNWIAVLPHIVFQRGSQCRCIHFLVKSE